MFRGLYVQKLMSKFKFLILNYGLIFLHFLYNFYIIFIIIINKLKANLSAFIGAID